MPYAGRNRANQFELWRLGQPSVANYYPTANHCDDSRLTLYTLSKFLPLLLHGRMANETVLYANNASPRLRYDRQYLLRLPATKVKLSSGQLVQLKNNGLLRHRGSVGGQAMWRLASPVVSSRRQLQQSSPSPSAERRSTNSLVYPTLVTAAALHQVGLVDTSPSAERRSTNNLVYPTLVTAAALHQVGLVDTSPCIMFWTRRVWRI